MAGDWIKMRIGLEETVEVFHIANATSLSTLEVVANLYRVACWFRVHGKEGKHNCGPSIIDMLIEVKGFGDAMVEVGWMQRDGKTLMLRGFSDTSSIRKGIGRKLRREILRHAVCAHCRSSKSLEIDHIIPVKKGGLTARENLQALCVTCNRRKGSK